MQRYSRSKQKWVDLYFFTERADLQADFVMMNFWIANHHSSIFREVRAAPSVGRHDINPLCPDSEDSQNRM